MKYFLSAISLLLLIQCTTAQNDSTGAPIKRENGEFPIYDNGLIYSEITMSKLGKVVDSLNLRFKTCEPKTYRSLEQGLELIYWLQKISKGLARRLSKT